MARVVLTSQDGYVTEGQATCGPDAFVKGLERALQLGLVAVLMPDGGVVVVPVDNVSSVRYIPDPPEK